MQVFSLHADDRFVFCGYSNSKVTKWSFVKCSVPKSLVFIWVGSYLWAFGKNCPYFAHIFVILLMSRNIFFIKNLPF